MQNNQENTQVNTKDNTLDNTQDNTRDKTLEAAQAATRGNTQDTIELSEASGNRGSATPAEAGQASTRIPASVAIIMDGNGRWAASRGLPRTMGHKEGCRTVEQIIQDAGALGIKYLTVYAFSTENWKRSREEVSGLMDLFRLYAVRLLKKAKENNVRIRMIGERSAFPEDIVDAINHLEDETKNNTGLTFVMAANYGGRDELVRAAAAFAKDTLSGKAALTPEKLNEKAFSSYLDTAGLPDPDLVIRTSGEMRISNFLLWQMAYAEIVVTKVLWPDFDRAELLRCIEEYNSRNRRFGGT